MNKIILLSLCALCSLRLIFSGCNSPEQQTSFPVVRVIDGDTIVISINGEDIHIRLLGIDAPERGYEPGFSKAKNFLAELINGKSVYLEYDTVQGKTDRFGRTLAFVYRAGDGLFINEELLKSGNAVVYEDYPCKYTEKWKAGNYPGL